MLKTAHLAEAAGLNYEIHHSGNSLNNLANLHVCMALRNTTMFEVLLPHEAHKFGLVTEIDIDKDGNIQAPAGPGLGANIDFAMIEQRDLAQLLPHNWRPAGDIVVPNAPTAAAA